ncbi:hypothetical protein F7734_10035 [Scytonema sp. UIC 10036]|uniref:hypothetical protein n=1 Tax=Scytonema sp. UIC 10036 TaxID=2304196 RepID=UPI0012DA6297|nr:hypothetical protein [Scytonema sp. UIC 10036]MUG92770.1 hypothetical protein [Scytonema sp. UIC 10036]
MSPTSGFLLKRDTAVLCDTAPARSVPYRFFIAQFFDSVAELRIAYLSHLFAW